MTVWTEELGQENQDRILGKDSQDWTGQPGQPGQDSQGRTARTGHLGKDKMVRI
jgi:hypothetical protein